MRASRKTIDESGLPLTRQRACILKTMRERYDHPEAEMVYEAVHKKIPNLSRDTVYRTLALFAQEGLIMQLALPSHRFRYEGQMHAHDHFICTRCEAVLDVDLPSETPCPIPETLAEQAVVAGVQTVYVGTCRHCLGQDDLHANAAHPENAEPVLNPKNKATRKEVLEDSSAPLPMPA